MELTRIIGEDGMTMTDPELIIRLKTINDDFSLEIDEAMGLLRWEQDRSKALSATLNRVKQKYDQAIFQFNTSSALENERKRSTVLAAELLSKESQLQQLANSFDELVKLEIIKARVAWETEIGSSK